MGTRWTLVVVAAVAAGACGRESDDDGMSSSGSGASCPCPDAPPASGDDCRGCLGFGCTYLDCDGIGETSAYCGTDERWSITTAACEPIDCGRQTCAAGQICVQISGGAIMLECADNPCETAVACECASSLCPSSATCSVSGTTLYCNTCPTNDCP